MPTARNLETGIILFLDLVFFGTALTLDIRGTSPKAADKAWEAFAGANGALFLILKTDAEPKNP